MSQGPCGHQSKHCRCPVFCLVIIWLSCFFMGLLDADDWFKHLFCRFFVRFFWNSTKTKRDAGTNGFSVGIWSPGVDITFATHQAGNAWGVVVIVSVRGAGWLVIWNLPDFKTIENKKMETWQKHTHQIRIFLNHLFSTRSCPTWPISNIPRGLFLQSLKNQKGPLGPGPLGPLGPLDTIYWDTLWDTLRYHQTWPENHPAWVRWYFFLLPMKSWWILQLAMVDDRILNTLSPWYPHDIPMIYPLVI